MIKTTGKAGDRLLSSQPPPICASIKRLLMAGLDKASLCFYEAADLHAGHYYRRLAADLPSVSKLSAVVLAPAFDFPAIY